MYHFYYHGDAVYYIFVAVAMLLGMLAQGYIKRTYARWKVVPASFEMTGAELARQMLSDEKTDVGIGRVDGELTDHFDPRKNRLFLSPANFDKTSVASVAVACHEAGHAVQRERGYGFYKLRALMAPAVQIGQNLWFILLIMGAFLNFFGLIQAGLVIFAGIVVFQLVTLPVEIDASRRALAYISRYGSETDIEGSRQVLRAAAMTYVVAALVSLGQFAYYFSRYNGFNRNR